MITFEWLLELFENCICFICFEPFEVNDVIGEFFGSYVHWECLDKQFKENERRRKEKEAEQDG